MNSAKAETSSDLTLQERTIRPFPHTVVVILAELEQASARWDAPNINTLNHLND